MSQPRKSRRFSFAVISFVVIEALLMLGFAHSAAAQAMIQVTTTVQGVSDPADCSLQEAIYSSEFKSNIAIATTDPDTFYTTGCTSGTGNGDTISLPDGATFTFDHSWGSDAYNPYGPTATPIIFSNVTILGNGATLQWSGTGSSRLFAIGTATITTPNGVSTGTGSLFLENVYVKGFNVKGGDGGFCGGGGGLGAGGAIYVQTGSLGIQDSTFDTNRAVGGNGGGCGGESAGGGGGGLYGTGGSGLGGFAGEGAGGGGGSRGNGGNSASLVSDEGGGGGGGTVFTGGDGYNPSNIIGDIPAYGGPGGYLCGGRGGDGKSDGNSATCPGGGGGGSGGTDSITFPPYFGSTGGTGAYGGGGGGGSGTGGNGGFGGGGGGGQDGSGGFGGFGGGGGGYAGCLGSCIAGHGGPFGGNGIGGNGNQGGGGGGALGGAIFSHGGAVNIFNSTFYNNSVARGAGQNGADNGGDSGGAIFVLDGSLLVFDATISNNQATGAGGGIVIYSDGSTTSLNLRDTIIANNGPNECFFTNASVYQGATAIGSGNLIVNNGVGTGPFTPCPGVVSSNDPALQPLQLNSPGNTPTMAILANSPAIGTADSGISLDRDQRGVVRPQLNGFDIGAYEARPADFSFSVLPATAVSTGGSISVTVTVNSFEYFSAPVTLSVSTPPPGVTVSFSPNPITPAANGSASSTMTISLAPTVTPGSYTPTISGASSLTATSAALTHSLPAPIVVSVTTASISTVIADFVTGGLIDTSGIAASLNTKLSTAQAYVQAGDKPDAITTLGAMIHELQAQTGKHLTASAAAALITDTQALQSNLSQ